MSRCPGKHAAMHSLPVHAGQESAKCAHPVSELHVVRVHVGVVALVVLSLFASMLAAQPSPEVLPEHSASADQAESWTLQQLQGWAEQNSPDLRRAAAEIEVQRGRAWQAGLYPNPTLDGGSNQLAGRHSQYFTMLSQEIVTKHKLQLDRAAMCKEVAQAELQFLRTRFDLLTNVRQSFYSALAAQRRLDELGELMQIARRSAHAAQILERSGEGARADTLLLELELERADFSMQNAAASLQAAHRQLAATLGDPDLVIQRLSGDLSAAVPDYPYELSRSEALSSNALLASAQLEIERNQILLRRAGVDPFPNLTVSGGYMYQVEEPHDMAIIQMSFPIPIWNKNQGNIHAARSGLSRAEHSARKVEVDLAKQLAGAIGRFEVARQQVTKYETSILPKAHESVQLAQRGFQQGQFDLLRVLQSQRVLIESELNYINAQENRWLAAAEIAGIIQQEEFPPPANDEFVVPEPQRR